MPDIGLQQKARQTQTMAMNQKMIQSIAILAMPAIDLREYLYDEAAKNPALEIIENDTVLPDAAFSGTKTADRARLTEKKPGSGAESDAYQAFLESRPAPEANIQEQLLSQLAFFSLGQDEQRLCKKIIGNLDTDGFHFEPPDRLLDPAFSAETPVLLEKCLWLVRSFDPAGTACTDSAESLYVQAKIRRDAPPLALFILHGRLGALGKQTPALIRKKLAALRLLADEKEAALLPGKITDGDIYSAIRYIRTLEPFPAREFDREEPAYITPDVYVHTAPDTADMPDESHFIVEFARASLPRLELSPVFAAFADKNTGKEKKGEAHFAVDLLKDAKWIIDTVDQREQTIVKTVQAIVKTQGPFFEQGPRFLRPLTMKALAETIGVHETTVSRIANGKYLQCHWGLFELRYFFSTKTAADGAGQFRSQESVKQELLLILKAHEEGQKSGALAKKLSDAALAQQLQERGIQIARRTVAKYRAELQNRG
jgi:RNA polymerase sigma-54 factor